MGITIHYSGRLANEAAYDLLLQELRDLAAVQKWEVTEIAEKDVELQRADFETEKEWTVTSDTRGLQLQPHESCEPLRFEFDRDNFMQDYCKTQFAPLEVHVAVVELLRRVQPFFTDFQVLDEGEYWDTSDFDRLGELFEEFFEAFEEARAAEPGVEGPIQFPNGRITDLFRPE